jgi:DNA-binding CsgD family transcriptional regulator
MRVTDVETAVEAFREAAILPDRWPRALETLAHALGSDGATLVLTPANEHRVISSANVSHLLRDFWRSRIPDSRDERVNPRLGEGFMPDLAYFSPREIANDPYYQDFMLPRGFGWNATAALGPDLMIGLKRGTRRGPYEGAELDALSAALPQLRSASRVASIAWRISFAGQLRAFEQVGRGALLLDSRGRVIECNPCVSWGDGLDVVDGHLHVPRPAERPRLQRFLAAVLDESGYGRVNPTTLVLPRPSGLRPLLLDGIPCTGAFRSMHSCAVGLVLITDLERPARLSSDLLTPLFGLTVTESRLAREIATGVSLREASRRLKITEGHARQRLKSVFAKTRTSRQGELIALLARLDDREPPVIAPPESN